MRITVVDGIGQSAARILSEAGHDVGPWTDLKDSPPVVWWTRLSKVETDRTGDIIATPCTGTDHVRGPRVLSLRDCGDLSGIRATVEMTIGLILSLTRRIPSAVESVRRGEWDRMRYQGTDLAGKYALVVGCNGRIGDQVYELLQFLEMEMFGCDHGVEPSLMELLPKADLVTVHCDLNPTSRGMFGAEQFAAMRKGSLFVNTARGAIADEAALLDALKSGHLAGAALDVFCTEPLPADSPLLAFAREQPERLFLSPHLGGCTRESMEKAETLLAHRLVEELAK